MFEKHSICVWCSTCQSWPEGVYPDGERCSLIVGCRGLWEETDGQNDPNRLTPLRLCVCGRWRGQRTSGLWGFCLHLCECINKRGLLSVNLDMCTWECLECVCVKQYCKRLVSACLWLHREACSISPAALPRRAQHLHRAGRTCFVCVGVCVKLNCNFTHTFQYVCVCIMSPRLKNFNVNTGGWVDGYLDWKNGFETIFTQKLQ